MFYFHKIKDFSRWEVCIHQIVQFDLIVEMVELGTTHHSVGQEMKNMESFHTVDDCVPQTQSCLLLD